MSYKSHKLSQKDTQPHFIMCYLVCADDKWLGKESSTNYVDLPIYIFDNGTSGWTKGFQSSWQHRLSSGLLITRTRFAHSWLVHLPFSQPHALHDPAVMDREWWTNIACQLLPFFYQLASKWFFIHASTLSPFWSREMKVSGKITRSQLQDNSHNHCPNVCCLKIMEDFFPKKRTR